jgi:DNA polymerase III subunit gamma/tau
MNNNLTKIFKPNNFKDLKFQEHIVEYLSNSVSKNLLFPAYIFYGNNGIGKTSTSRIFAKVINCINIKIENNILINCNNCLNCNLIDNKNHPDYKEIDVGINGDINSIRNIISSLYYKSSVLKYKILILDECDCLTSESSKALLKTIEGLPKNVLVMLLTTNINGIIDAMLSRCQVLYFQSVNYNDIVNYLNMIISKDKIKINNEFIESIAYKANGSLRYAINNFEIVYNATISKIKQYNIYKLISFVPIEIINDIYNCLVNKKLSKLSEILNKLYNDGFILKNVWKQIILFLNKVLIKYNKFDDFFLKISKLITFIYDLFEKDSFIKLDEKTFNDLIILELHKLL